MRIDSVPQVNARYWSAIIAASMCGTNMGDFFAEYLHLGNEAGIVPILAIAGLVLWVEGRAPRPSEAYYWLAIIMLRTVATNIADASHALHLGFAVVGTGLAALLIVLVAAERLWRRQPAVAEVGRAGVPNTDMAYWVAMLTAGTLGTAAGDFVQGRSGFALGSGMASVATFAAFLVVLFLAYRLGGMAKGWYWTVVVMARTAGTDIGDFMAGGRGLGLGLPVSLACTTALLVSIILIWPRRRGDLAATPS